MSAITPLRPTDDEDRRSAVRADVRKLYADFGASMHMHVLKIGGALIRLREYCKDNNELWMAQFPTTAAERADGSQVPFSYRTGMAFISIAGNEAIANLHHDATVAPSVLPADWNSLYALSRIPAPKLTSLIEDGMIQPGMDRDEIHQLCDATLRVSAKRQRDQDDDADLDAHLPGEGLPPVRPGIDDARDIRANAEAAGRRYLDDAAASAAEPVGPTKRTVLYVPQAPPADVVSTIIHMPADPPEARARVIHRDPPAMTLDEALKILAHTQNCRPMVDLRYHQRMIRVLHAKLKKSEVELGKAEARVIAAATKLTAEGAKRSAS
jgi:hypothetical protein